MKQLTDTITALAYALTNKMLEKQHLDRLPDLIGGVEFYLPDGGYSRIVVSETTGHAFLTSNSTDFAKQAWGRSRELIADLERDVRAIRAADGWTPIDDTAGAYLGQKRRAKLPFTLIGKG